MKCTGGRVAFFPKIATRWIYFIHIFRQLLIPNLSKSEKQISVLAFCAYYTDFVFLDSMRQADIDERFVLVEIWDQPDQSVAGKGTETLPVPEIKPELLPGRRLKPGP